eukprot:scaffold23891_cov132-Cylindrotheca_fusiformis.AAC.5
MTPQIIVDSIVKDSIVNTTVGMNNDDFKQHPYGNDLGPPIELDISFLTQQEEESKDEVHHFHSRLTPSHYTYCMELLESSTVAENRKGLQLFSLLVTFEIRIDDTPVSSNVAETIVYGSDATADRVRDLLLKLICDPGTRIEFDDDQFIGERSVNDDDDSTSDFSATISSLDESSCGEDGPQGYHWGALHSTTLRIISRCLEHIVTRNPNNGSTGKAEEGLQCIDLGSHFWTRIFSVLSHNLEKGCSADISGYSLRLLRLLQQLEPGSVNQLVQYSLLPFILELQDYGNVHNYPMIRDETERITKQLRS